MKIVQAEYVTGIAALPRFLQVQNTYSCPEICVVGRSNVGKSTFINCVTGRKKLARASVTPGRTRLINLFSLNGGKLMLVDLPGYGYAAAPKTERSGWAKLIEGYLQNSAKLKRVFALVDIRHEPSVLDKQMLAYLYAYNVPFTVVATKADKLPKSQISQAVLATAAALGIGRDDVVVFSGTLGTGKQQIESIFDDVLNAE